MTNTNSVNAENSASAQNAASVENTANAQAAEANAQAAEANAQAHQIAADLLSIRAVTLRPNDPFVWASGLHAPIYTDNRLTISYPQVRTHIAQALAALITRQFGEVDVIAGTATAGIPHAAWLAAELNKPMIYVRSKPKDHGQGRQIEGTITPGARTVVIDDLISTGGSVLKAVKAAEGEGAKVLGVASIFNYELPEARENFAAAGMPYFSATSYSTLISEAIAQGFVDEADREVLAAWSNDPEGWSLAHGGEPLA